MEACTKTIFIPGPAPMPADYGRDYPWAAFHFHALNRFLGACTSTKPAGLCSSEGNPEFVALSEHCHGVRAKPVRKVPVSPLLELENGPYFIIASFLDAVSLSRADCTSRQIRHLNSINGGPWGALGAMTFRGMELDSDGIFEQPTGSEQIASAAKGMARVDWKGRFARFRHELPTFRAPFVGPEIIVVDQADEIAYCRCRLRTDLLGVGSEALGSAYLEVHVLKNPDNVSLAVVDFEAGGCSSVTFSPDTGAVIRERKVREAPRKVEGAYVQPLNSITSGRGFEGSMGLYLRGGQLAFFRRHAARPASETRANAEAGERVDLSETLDEPELGPWETTGFVTDLSWAEGRRLTPCLAFRNEGAYHVQMICVSSQPPIPAERNVMAYEDGSWSSLDWDATEQAEQELQDGPEF